ncbi:hypothetical protein ACTFIY_011758 [Dictyostelium cf. discoideum]
MIQLMVSFRIYLYNNNKFESKFNDYKFQYENNGGVLRKTLDITIILPQGYSRQPYTSFLPIGRPSWVPTVLIEVRISQSTRYLVDKCYSYFAKPHIEKGFQLTFNLPHVL